MYLLISFYPSVLVAQTLGQKSGYWRLFSGREPDIFLVHKKDRFFFFSLWIWRNQAEGSCLLTTSNFFHLIIKAVYICSFFHSVLVRLHLKALFFKLLCFLFFFYYEAIDHSENEFTSNHSVLLLWAAESTYIDSRTMFVSAVNILTKAQRLICRQAGCYVHRPSSWQYNPSPVITFKLNDWFFAQNREKIL